MPLDRRGILSVDPVAPMMPRAPDSVTRAMGLSHGLYDMLGKHYENQFKAAQARNQNLEADKRAGTLESDILAGNTKNQADVQYYPQELKAKIGEVMARTGLSQAEAKAAIARSSASYALANLHNAAARNTGVQGQMLDQYLKDKKFGSNKSGAGGTYVDPQTGQVISTPTNATTTQDQRTIMATERVKPLIQDIIKNIPQFQTAQSKAALKLQQIGNLAGGNYPLPDQYAQAQQDLELAPESLLKAYGLNVTDDSLKTMKEALTPKYGQTAKGAEKMLYRTLDHIQVTQQQAMNAQSEGIPVGSRVAQGFNGNPNLKSDGNHPQEFASREDAQAYYQSLSPEEQQNYLDSLGE